MQVRIKYAFGDKISEGTFMYLNKKVLKPKVDNNDHLHLGLGNGFVCTRT